MIVQLTVGILFVFMSCISCSAAEPSLSALSPRISGNSASEPSASDGQIRDLTIANQNSFYEIILPVDTLGGMKYDPLSAYRAINLWPSSNVSVAFRLSLPPYVKSNRPPPVNKYADYLQRLNEHKIASGFPSDLPYYVTVAASDFYRHVCPINPALQDVNIPANIADVKRCVCGPKMLKDVWDKPEQMYMDPYIAKELLKDPNIKGLYIHELMVFSNGTIGRDHSFNCQKDRQDTPILWDKLIEYAHAAKLEGKKIIWNDAGDDDAWKWLLNLLDRVEGTKKIDQDKATELFKNYGSVIVPLWANNRDTEDQNENDYCTSDSTKKRVSCDKINNSIKAVYKIAERHTKRFGASIQDWHTDANYYPKFIPKPPKDQLFHNCVERDIRNYILKAQGSGAKVFEFESYWTGEGFFKALLELKKVLQSGSTISAGNWPRPLQCKKPKPPPKG